MNTNLGLSSAKMHVKRAGEQFKEWVALKTYVQKQKAQKTGIQLGVSAVFGFFLLVWAEVTLYLTFAASMKPYFSGLLVFGFNLIVFGGVNLAIMSWKKRVKASEDRVKQQQLEGVSIRSEIAFGALSAPDAVFRAAKKRHEATLELMTARTEVIHSTGTFVADVKEKIRVPVKRYVVQPFIQYRMPIALSSSFLIGLFAARALLPKREIEPGVAIEITEVPMNTLKIDRKAS